MRRQRAEHLADPAQTAGPERLAADRERLFASRHKSFRERARDGIESYRQRRFAWVRQALFDRFHAAQVIAREAGVAPRAWTSLQLTKNLGSTMASVLRDAPLEVYRDPALGPWFRRAEGWPRLAGFETIFKPLADTGELDHWKLWKVARRADRLMGEGRERLIDQETIDRYKDAHLANPHFLEVDRQWQAFNERMLRMATDAGLITAELRDTLLEHGDYVPFYRVVEGLDGEAEVKGATRGRLGVASSGLRALQGGESRLNDPIENMVMNMTALVDRSFKNLAMQKVIAEAAAVGAVVKAPYRPVPRRIEAGEAAAALEALGVDVSEMTEEQQQETLLFFRMQRPRGPNVISVMNDGEAAYYTVRDPLLLAAMETLGPSQLGRVMQLFSGAKSLLTRGVTATPDFMAANSVRDSLAAFIMYGINPLQSVRGALAGARESDPHRLAIMAAGGGVSGFYNASPEEAARFIEQHIGSLHGSGKLMNPVDPRDWWRLWQRVGEASENANRIARYRQVIAAGGSPAEAAFEAMDLMDFGMRGQAQAVQTLIAMVPFLNARLQGLYKLGRRAAEDPRGLLRRGLVITAVTLAILADNWDDERYEELEEWKKDAYWHVFVGDEHVKIPKPFEVGLLFASVPERIVRAMTGKDETKQSADFLLRAVVDTLAFNPVPQLALPLVEQYANRDTFTGRPIENFSMELLPAEMRYRADTPLVARGLGALTGTSPVRIQHLVEGYLGGIGTYALQATDVLAYGLGLGAGERPTARIADWPVVRRFYDQQPQRTTRYVTEFYNLKKEVEQTVKGLKALQAEGDADAARDYAVNHRDKLALYRTVEHAAQALTRLHQQSLIVQRSPTMSGDAKRAALDRIAEQRNRLTQSVMQRAKATTTMIERLSRDDAARWRLIEAGG